MNSTAFEKRRFAWVHRIMAADDLPASVKLVAYQISRGFNEDEGGVSWLGCRAISTSAGVSKGTVIDAVRRLEARGDLRVEVGHQGNSSRYWMVEQGQQADLFDRPQGQPADLASRSVQPRTRSVQRSTRSAGRPNLISTQQETQEGKNIYPTPGGVGVGKSPDAIEESTRAAPSAHGPPVGGQPKSQPADPGADAKGLSQTYTPDDFDRFWAAFPRRCSIGAADPGQLIAAAKRYAIARAAVVARDATQADFTKYPETWLRDECWLDEVCTTAVQTIDQAGNVVAFPQVAEKSYRRDRTWDEVEANVAMWGDDAYAQQH
jgi:hypothetical protein